MNENTTINNDNYPVESAIQAAYLMLGNSYESVGEFVNAFINSIGIATPEYLPNNLAPAFIQYNMENEQDPSEFPDYGENPEYENTVLDMLQQAGYQDGLYNPLKGQLGYISQYDVDSSKFNENYIGMAIRVGDYKIIQTYSTTDPDGDKPDARTYYKSLAFDIIYWNPETKTAEVGTGFISGYGENGLNTKRDDITEDVLNEWNSTGEYEQLLPPDPTWMTLNTGNGYYYSYGGFAIPNIPTEVKSYYYYGDPIFGGKLNGVITEKVSETETRFIIPETIPAGNKGAGMKLLYTVVNTSIYTGSTFVHYHPGTVSSFKVIAYYDKTGFKPSRWMFMV